MTSLISSRCRICQYIHIVKREREGERENELPPFLFLSRAELVIAPSGKDTRHAFHPILIHFSISFILFSFSSSYSLRYIYTLGVLHLISFFPRYLLTVLFSSVAHYLIRDSAYTYIYNKLPIVVPLASFKWVRQWRRGIRVVSTGEWQGQRSTLRLLRLPTTPKEEVNYGDGCIQVGKKAILGAHRAHVARLDSPEWNRV